MEVCSVVLFARSAEIFFRLHFSLLRMGSRGTFALCTASSRCTRIACPRAAMSFFLGQISLTNRNKYVHVRTRTRRGILDRGLVPKPFGFRQRTVSLLRAEARPGVAT